MTPQDALQRAQTRLSGEGFEFLPNAASGNFLAAARRSRFEISKFGNFEVFFVFVRLERPDIPTVQSYSANAFQYALKNKKFGLPCGFFEAVCCYPVALVEWADPGLVAFLRNETPPKHWSAFEMPVVWNVAQDELYCLEKTPIWGAAYYSSFRKQAYAMLGRGAEGMARGASA
ncbi:MAG TPA: hypothetical protein VMH05_08510 [Bryobacteraceae bacterium]|nr:hypothetical protein [Bryobacteraceae bacterium]HUA60345.1 hypothetical protein [Verrucomicrobiae bacterium]